MSRIRSLMCKVSEGIYKKYLEKKHGLRTCTGKLKDKKIEDMLEDMDLLLYLNKSKSCDCDKDKIIEQLT